MKTKIRYKNKDFFVEPVDDNPRESNGDVSPYFMYIVTDANEEGLGCITFNWTDSARVTAHSLTFRSDAEEEIAYLALIPYLPFFPEKIHDLYQYNQYKCFHYQFNTGITGLAKQENEYSIKVENGFKKTVQRLMFGGTPTDDQVRRQLLICLHNKWLEDPQAFLQV